MKLATMLSAATLVVALGLTNAQAQAPGEMDQSGPPAAAPGGPKAGGESGGAPDMGPAGARDRGPGGAPEIEPGAPGPGAMQDERGGPGLAGPKGDQPGLSAEGKGDLETGGKTGTKAEGDLGAEGQSGSTAEGRRGDKAGKSVKLERQQVSKVRSHFSQNKPSVKSINKTNVSVSIGVALPGTIALYDLPPGVIVVSGACPIKYFVWGDDIVLVDSCTREVVEIIVGVA
jgi:hypothetical protein